MTSPDSSDIDYYKYLYKYERGASSTYNETTTSSYNVGGDGASITPPLQENPLSASVICGLSPSPDPQFQNQIEQNTEPIPISIPIPIDIKDCPPYIVEPLSLMRSLSELSIKPIRTKISIVNHEIVLHEPGMFQGIVRYYNNSNKHDLRYLQVPIEIACMQYIILPTYAEKRKDFIKLFQEAARGLENLAKTYENEPMVALCINQYINIIHNAISMRSIVLSPDVYGLRKYYAENR